MIRTAEGAFVTAVGAIFHVILQVSRTHVPTRRHPRAEDLRISSRRRYTASRCTGTVYQNIVVVLDKETVGDTSEESTRARTTIELVGIVPTIIVTVASPRERYASIPAIKLRAATARIC